MGSDGAGKKFLRKGDGSGEGENSAPTRKHHIHLARRGWIRGPCGVNWTVRGYHVVLPESRYFWQKLDSRLSVWVSVIVWLGLELFLFGTVSSQPIIMPCGVWMPEMRGRRCLRMKWTTCCWSLGGNPWLTSEKRGWGQQVYLRWERIVTKQWKVDHGTNNWVWIPSDNAGGKSLIMGIR